MNKVEVMISKKMEVFNNIPVIQSRKIEVTEWVQERSGVIILRF